MYPVKIIHAEVYHRGINQDKSKLKKDIKIFMRDGCRDLNFIYT